MATVDAEWQAQFAELGVQVEIEETEDDGVAVWADNWRSFTAFLAVATQWRVAPGIGAAVRLGLDYAGVRAGLDLRFRNARIRRRVFGDLQVMEAAALQAFDEGRE